MEQNAGVNVLMIAMDDEEELKNLLEKIYTERSYDFRGYKKSSLKRRIQKRMLATQIKSYAEYAQLLDTSPQEYEKLLETLTIKVTEFFRDEEIFRAVEEILLEIIKGKLGQRKIRVWCPGCATGEEAYSIVMLLAEKLGEELGSYEIKIYATDISREAIATARAGEYARNKLKNILEALRGKYFEAGRIKKHIRSMIIFGAHNLITDPPISHLDALFCRNMLIYFTHELQSKVLLRLHAALEKGGFLVLGKSESLPASAANLFRQVNKLPIYRRL